MSYNPTGAIGNLKKRGKKSEVGGGPGSDGNDVPYDILYSAVECPYCGRVFKGSKSDGVPIHECEKCDCTDQGIP